MEYPSSAPTIHTTPPSGTTPPLSALFFSLVASGRFPLEGLTSHVFAPDQCAEAYLTANRDRSSTMGLIFDWANILKK